MSYFLYSKNTKHSMDFFSITDHTMKVQYGMIYFEEYDIVG